MGIVRTNTIGVSLAPEVTVGTPPSSGWTKFQPNTVPDGGAVIDRVERTPISPERAHYKGSPVGLSSKPSVECDLTMHHVKMLTSLALYAKPTAMYGGLAAGAAFRPTSVTSTAYVVASGGALTAGAIVFARGFAVAGNNGAKVVGAASDGTHIKTSGLAAETTTVPQNATVEVVGVQGASDDITILSASTIGSTVLDFTTLGLKVGQYVIVGDPTSAAFMFATAADQGAVRLTAIAAHLLTFDKARTTFVADAGAGKTIRLIFGPFIRDVATSDPDWNYQSQTIELAWPNLDSPNPMYEYWVGNYIDQLSLPIPLKAKSTMKVSFVGTDAQVPTDTRTSGASNAYAATETVLFNTSSDIGRLRASQDVTGITTYWKSLTLNFKNNLSPLEVLALFGALDVNYGFLDVTVEGEALFTDDAVIAAVRNNVGLNFDVGLSNDDGGFIFDVPSMTFGNGKRNAPANDVVTVQVTGLADKGAAFGYQASFSLFPYYPTA